MVQEIEDAREIVCSRCKKLKPVSDIKYESKSGEKLVALCSVCRSKKNVDSNIKAKKTSKKLIYYCTRCRYKFNFDPDRGSALKCPYCGRDDKVSEYKNPSAAELLKISMNE